MDWGLLRASKGSPRFLRDKYNYHPCFYYWCIFSDFVLRFWWVAGLFAVTNGVKGNVFHDLKLFAGINIVLEAFRRAQWSLVRVENEQNNNFEGYRTIAKIPPIVHIELDDN